MPPKTPTAKYIRTVGRRRSSTCSVKLYTGKGDLVVNTMPIEKYFPGETFKIKYMRPFAVTETEGKFHFTAKILGGGKVGQSGALVLAIARALRKTDIKFGPPLRQAGLLTVDSRVRERRMVGTGGKARRQKQSPKR